MSLNIGDDVEVPVSYGGTGYAKIVDILSPYQALIRWYWTYNDLANVAGFNQEELDEEGFERDDIAETQTETTVTARDIIRPVYLPEPRFFFDPATQELTPLEQQEDQEREESLYRGEKLAQHEEEMSGTETENEELQQLAAAGLLQSMRAALA